MGLWDIVFAWQRKPYIRFKPPPPGNMSWPKSAHQWVRQGQFRGPKFRRDEVLSADGQFLGEVVVGIAGAILTFGQLCYLAVADSKWELTDADVEATAGPIKLGICVDAAAEDGATAMLLRGRVRADAAFPALTVGAPVHVGTTTGAVQVAAPVAGGDTVRVIGYGNTADELYFCPDNSYSVV